MKKNIFLFSFVAVLLSCKKDKTATFTPTDVTGTSVVKGNVSKNAITPNASGGWMSTALVPAVGVNVSIKVNKSSLYPNSTAQGADVYTGTTDSNGNYSISVKTNATGVDALISIDGFTATLDTMINGAAKPGLYSTFAGTSEIRTLYMGQNSQLDYSFTGVNVTTNPNTIPVGTAVITGSIGMSILKEAMVGPNVIVSPVIVPVQPNLIVHMSFTKDPSLLGTKSYTALTTSGGIYNFNLSTVAAGTSGFPQNATIWIDDYPTTRDTIKIGGTIATGHAGVFKMQSTNETGVYNGAIRNAVDLNYTNFVEN